MPRKTVTLLILLAIVPLVGFAWLGWRTARGEEARIAQGYRRLFEARLAQENAKLTNYFERKRRELAEQCVVRRDDTQQLREFVRSSPLVRQAIVLDRKGDLIHPAVGQAASEAERAFVGEIRQLLIDKDLVRASFGAGSQLASSSNPKPANSVAEVVDSVDQNSQPAALSPPADSTSSQPSAPPSRTSYRSPSSATAGTNISADGWYVWYFERGAHVLYWHRWSDERVTVVALSRPRYMADLLNVLPNDMPGRAAKSTSDSSEGAASNWRICLVDGADRVVYQWGSRASSDSEPPLAQASVGDPLSAWRLKYFGRSDVVGYSRLPLVGGILSLAIGLLAIVVTLYRDYTRDMREASQRVTFVNQVSHELKTPLTNIRMYADLLEVDLSQLPTEEATRPQSRLNVIVSESQRLSRLIANVLSFARSERNQLQISRRATEFDGLVRDVLERFAPALKNAGIEVRCQLDVPYAVDVDADAVQQIVGNLVSNVLNYAADGKTLHIETRYADEQVAVVVCDDGPGISANLKRRLFEPFVRESSQLNDVNGTGIGLSIARRIARAHGGDLVLEPISRGAKFCLTLSVRPDIPVTKRKANRP